jgi:hypothetical protein
MHAYVQPHVLASLCRPARARGQAATPPLADQPAMSSPSIVSCTLVESFRETNDSRFLLAASHEYEFLTFSFVAACACALDLWVKNLKKRM